MVTSTINEQELLLGWIANEDDRKNKTSHQRKTEVDAMIARILKDKFNQRNKNYHHQRNVSTKIDLIFRIDN